MTGVQTCALPIVFVQFLVEDHRAALGTLGPQAFGDAAFLGFGARQLGLPGERGGVAGRRGRGQGRFAGIQPQVFFRKGRRSHDRDDVWIGRVGLG